VPRATGAPQRGGGGLDRSSFMPKPLCEVDSECDPPRRRTEPDSHTRPVDWEFQEAISIRLKALGEKKCVGCDCEGDCYSVCVREKGEEEAQHPACGENGHVRPR